MSDPHRVTSEAQLRAILGEPKPTTQKKVLRDRVDEFAADFIAHAPMLFLATCNAAGEVDVSPKGDAPGFVAVEGERTLLIPDRLGNKLAFGFLNLLERPEVGILFVVPGVTETLRVNGQAEITCDPALLERFAVDGRPALLVTRVRVRECFFHCGKAFLRSSLWRPDGWAPGYKPGVARQLSRVLAGDESLVDAIDAGLQESYRDRLY